MYKHAKLSEKEKEALLTKYDISIAEMPQINIMQNQLPIVVLGFEGRDR